ncbi:MAG: hypothetical protein ABI818_20930 [Acidobacteriota bacterium]
MFGRTFAAVTLTCLIGATTPTRAHDMFRFVGTVVKMDVAKKSLRMKFVENKKELVVDIAVTERTPIERDGKKASRSDLKPGLNVVVDALGDDYESLVAEKIKIVPPPR